MTRDEKIDKIYELLVGNEDMRQTGLIERVEILEQKAEDDKHMKSKITGGVLVLSFIGSSAIAFVAWIINKFWE